MRRFYKNTELTLGMMLCDNIPYPIYTLEPPWLHNKEDYSSIPIGVYIIELYLSPKHGDCFLVKDVPDRTEIEIHIGNFIHETIGCILVGMYVGKLNIYNNPSQLFCSTTAVNLLLDIIKKPIELHISDCSI